jgi:hypothetical protein
MTAFRRMAKGGHFPNAADMQQHASAGQYFARKQSNGKLIRA